MQQAEAGMYVFSSVINISSVPLVGIILKVHMKRFFTVVFHFIIVKMNIKESYIT